MGAIGGVNVCPHKPVVALIFPSNSAYSRGLTEGVIDRHFRERDWTIIELPRHSIGTSPLPERPFRLNGAITWAEPRDRFVQDLITQRVPVVNCGMEWGDSPGVMRVHLRQEALHATVIRHFQTLGLRQAVALGHQLDQRPATRAVLASFVKMADAAGIKAWMWDIGGAESPSASPRRLLEFREETELASYLTNLPKPIGVYCCGDHIGYLVGEVANHIGVKVPKDLAIIGIGANTVGSLAHPPLSSVASPAREIGRVAADQLALWLATGTRPANEITVEGAELIERESTVGRSGRAVLEGLRRFIHERAAQGVTLGELAAFARLSPKTLVRHYVEMFGCAPLVEAQQLRVAEARRLLACKDVSVAEAAHRCGFSSPAAFYNYFKRHDGSSPSEHRAPPPK